MATDTAIQKSTPQTIEVRGQHARPTAWTYRPLVDVFDLPDELIVEADLPGARSEEIDVSVENGILTIAAAVPPRQAPHGRSICQEYGVGSFHRRFEVDEMIDAERINAEYRDGVLRITLPKTQHARRRRIPVTG